MVYNIHDAPTNRGSSFQFSLLFSRFEIPFKIYIFWLILMCKVDAIKGNHNVRHNVCDFIPAIASIPLLSVRKIMVFEYVPSNNLIYLCIWKCWTWFFFQLNHICPFEIEMKLKIQLEFNATIVTLISWRFRKEKNALINTTADSAALEKYAMAIYAQTHARARHQIVIRMKKGKKWKSK